MLLMTVMQTAYQLREIWLKLARLLYRLESTPMKCAFEKIGKDDRIHIKIWDLGKAALRFDEMSLIIESLMRDGVLFRGLCSPKGRRDLSACRP